MDPNLEEHELRKSIYINVLIDLIYNNMLKVIDDNLITFNNSPITLYLIKNEPSAFEFLFNYSFEYITETSIYGVEYPIPMSNFIIRNRNNFGKEKYIEEIINKNKYRLDLSEINKMPRAELEELFGFSNNAEFEDYEVNHRDMQTLKNEILKLFSNQDTADF
tara:strand:- start:30 stop:518 length:489 start_codon:yes stop_codon:yes gene_type:complete